MSRNDPRESRPVYLTWTNPISKETVLVAECFSAKELSMRLGITEQAVNQSCLKGRPMLSAAGTIAHYGEIGVIGERSEWRKTGDHMGLPVIEPDL